MIRLPKLRLVDVSTIASALVVFWAFFQGFTESSQFATVIFGLSSCIFWLAASSLPIYWEKMRNNVDVINGLNAFAAASTGAAVLSSVPKAWTILFG